MLSPSVTEWYDGHNRANDPDYDNKRLKHCIINYDIATDEDETEERKDIKKTIEQYDHVQLSKSCYLIRSSLDHIQLFDEFKDHASQESDRLSVTPLAVFDCQDPNKLAFPLVPHGDDLLNDLRSKGYHYLVDPEYLKKQ